MNAGPIRLVIPCYRDGTRLAEYLPDLCTALAASSVETILQVVDDGSPAAEQAMLRRAIEATRPSCSFLQPLIAHPVNRGKGSAIRSGWAQAPRADWLAFVDADGAVPASEVAELLARVRAAGQPAVFIADRTASREKFVERFWYRRAGSRLFNRWVKFWLHLDLPDTQCGLKVIPASLHGQWEWKENGFAFDLELLLRARQAGLPIVTQPISWHEKPGSNLGPGAMLRLFFAAWRLPL